MKQHAFGLKNYLSTSLHGTPRGMTHSNSRNFRGANNASSYDNPQSLYRQNNPTIETEESLEENSHQFDFLTGVNYKSKPIIAQTPKPKKKEQTDQFLKVRDSNNYFSNSPSRNRHMLPSIMSPIKMKKSVNFAQKTTGYDDEAEERSKKLQEMFFRKSTTRRVMSFESGASFSIEDLSPKQAQRVLSQVPNTLQKAISK